MERERPATTRARGAFLNLINTFLSPFSIP
jgi:hypothetical protein